MDRLSSRCLKEMKDMKTNMKYLAAAAALVLAASCTREVIETNAASDPEAITLELICADPITKTAGTTSENQVTTMDYWFFKDTTDAPAFHFRETVSFTDKTTKDFIPGETYGSAEFPKRSELIGTDGTCVVFVAANLPSSVSVTATSLEDLQNTVVDQTFMTATTGSDGKPVYSSNPSATSFIMSGKVAVKGTRQKTTATSTAEVVQLQRLAAKLTANVNVIATKAFTGIVYEEAQDGQEAKTYTETWEPMLSGNNVRMYPQYVASKAVLGASDGKHFLAEDQLNKIDYAPFIPPAWADNVKTGYKSIQNVGPYYLYPSDANGSSTSFKIIVPWKVTRTDEATGTVLYTAQREIYYKVMLPDSKVLANNWYQLTVDIDVIGTEGEPEVEIEGTYQVVDWTTGAAGKVNTQISDVKYLTVDRKKENADGIVEIFITNGQVQYSASETAVIDWTQSSIYYLDYVTTGLTDNKRYIINNGTFNAQNGGKASSESVAKGWVTLTTVSNPNDPEHPDTYLTLNHTLVNSLTANNFDATPYFYDITLKLSTGGADPKTVHFKQYPQSYIEEKPNTGDDEHWVAGHYSGWEWIPGQDVDFGYVFVNGGHNGYENYGGVSGLTGTNQNPNMYVVTTSVLSDANKTIGDPRIGKDSYDNINSGNEGNWNPERATAPVVSGGSNRQLKYYKRTDNGERSRNMIAPSFRIASSYGVTSALSYANASRRCASYQEDGYPAGRWRLPTAAEIEYCVTLSAKGRLPMLFGQEGVSTDYWSSNGYLTVNGNNVTPHVTGNNRFSGNRYVRCVYDEWYWGPNKVADAQHTFMWGDEEDPE